MIESYAFPMALLCFSIALVFSIIGHASFCKQLLRQCSVEKIQHSTFLFFFFYVFYVAGILLSLWALINVHHVSSC